MVRTTANRCGTIILFTTAHSLSVRKIREENVHMHVQPAKPAGARQLLLMLFQLVSGSCDGISVNGASGPC